MSLTYQTYCDTIRTVAEVPSNMTDKDFESIIARTIEYAEGRIYREFDFLCTYSSQTATATINNRNVVLPSNIVDLASVNVITPSSQTSPDSGTRNPLTRTSIDFLNGVYNSSTGATLPKYYAIIGNPTIGSTITAGNYNILLGPFPDAAYTLECVGTVRPTLLGPPAATADFLSTNLPDLLLAASMIFITGYQQNFGSQSDNPQMAQSWEQQYQTLKASANLEELRRKAQGPEWSAYMPTPANAPRDRAQ